MATWTHDIRYLNTQININNDGVLIYKSPTSSVASRALNWRPPIPEGREGPSQQGLLVDVASLVRFRISASLTSIPEGAFQYSVSLTKVVIPNSVQHIGPDSFGHCVSFVNMHLVTPGNHDYIGDRGFRACNSFSKVTLPRKVKQFGKDIFIDCNLQEAPSMRPTSSRRFVVWALA